MLRTVLQFAYLHRKRKYVGFMSLFELLVLHIKTSDCFTSESTFMNSKTLGTIYFRVLIVSVNLKLRTVCVMMKLKFSITYVKKIIS